MNTKRITANRVRTIANRMPVMAVDDYGVVRFNESGSARCLRADFESTGCEWNEDDVAAGLTLMRNKFERVERAKRRGGRGRR
jgi:hypothetical protein